MKLNFHFKFLLYLVVVLAFTGARAGSYEDFFKAIERDDAATVTALLQRGFDPNTPDEKGQVPLYLALRNPSPAVAQALWAHPALDVNAANSVGETPLMMAALRGNLEWARRLLERGARVHQEGWSPIHYAATGPSVELLKLLIDKGAPVNARSPNGTTPLMMAARYGSEASVTLLRQRGADVQQRNDVGASAADFAGMAGRDALAKTLQGR